MNIIKAKTMEEMKCSMLLYLSSNGFLQQDPNKVKKSQNEMECIYDLAKIRIYSKAA